MRHVLVHNKGQRDSKVLIVPAAVGSKFQVLPSEMTVKAGGSAHLKVEFNAIDLGVATLKVPPSRH